MNARVTGPFALSCASAAPPPPPAALLPFLVTAPLNDTALTCGNYTVVSVGTGGTVAGPQAACTTTAGAGRCAMHSGRKKWH